jgi:hypothetical protein
VNEHEQLAYLWKVIDQLHSAAQDATQGHSSSVALSGYVLQKTKEAMKNVPYPGEPPEAIWEEETQPDDNAKD